MSRSRWMMSATLAMLLGLSAAGAAASEAPPARALPGVAAGSGETEPVRIAQAMEAAERISHEYLASASGESELLEAPEELGATTPEEGRAWEGFDPSPWRARPHVEPSESGLVTNMFFETDLRSALSDIAQQTGNIIVPDLSVQGLISAELNDVTLEKALEIVLAPGGYIYKRMDGFILVTSPLPDSPSFRSISQVALVRLSHMDAKVAVGLFSDTMQKYLKADADARLVVITAPPEIIAHLEGVLREMDRPPRQVLMDVLVVILEEGTLSNMGLQWDWPQAAAGIFSNDDRHGATRVGASWPWGVQFGYTTGREFTNSLVATLNLLSQNDEATVLASPQVIAQEGKEAEVNVSTEEYFEILTQGFYTNSQLEKIEAGTILKITPFLGDGDEISLQLEAEVSDVVARGVNNLPVVTRRTAKSTVRVQDGGTAAVAGLIDNRSRLGNERVPGLGRVPVMGRAFRNESRNQVSRQVAIFVTPRTLPIQPLIGLPERSSVEVAPVGEEFREELRKSLQKTGKEGRGR